MMKKFSLVVTILMLYVQLFAQNSIEMDLNKHFEKYGVDGCFVLFNQNDSSYIRYNLALCDEGYIPASTFKIPNSLIAIEEGIVSDTNQIIKWNGHQWPVENWNKDQTIKTAIKYSCIWVYIGFAEQLGIEKYRHYIDAFNYGNKNLSGPPNKFWLSGPFRISANQQINFLRSFYNNELSVSKKATTIVKDIIVLENTANYRLSGKTGGGTLTDGESIMWLVGYLEKENNTWFYALNFKTSDFDKTKLARYEIVKSIFRELDLMD